MERSRTQDAARSAADLVGAEVRSIPSGAIIRADSTRFVFRKPLGVGLLCAYDGADHILHLRGGVGGIDTGEVSGFAVRDASGDWAYTSASWSSLYRSTSGAATACAQEGADTVDVSADFLRFRDLESISGETTELGDPVLLYRSVELRFDDSELDSTTRALYWGTYGDTLIEFATGFDTLAHFAYRRGDTTHTAPVASSNLDEIDGVRVFAWAKSATPSANREPPEFDLTADFRIRNRN